METLCRKVIAAQDNLMERFVRFLGLLEDEDDSPSAVSADCSGC